MKRLVKNVVVWGSVVAGIIVIRISLKETKITSENTTFDEIEERNEENNGFLLKVKKIVVKNIEKFTKKVVVSQTVADWQYKDLLFFKLALSRRLGVVLIALPFLKWKVIANQNSDQEEQVKIIKVVFFDSWDNLNNKIQIFWKEVEIFFKNVEILSKSDKINDAKEKIKDLEEKAKKQINFNNLKKLKEGKK